MNALSFATAWLPLSLSLGILALPTIRKFVVTTILGANAMLIAIRTISASEEQYRARVASKASAISPTAAGKNSVAK